MSEVHRLKGTILKCLGDMVRQEHGDDRWRDVLVAASVDPATLFVPSLDVDEATAMRVLAASCGVLRLSTTELYDAFATHWVEVYVPRVYPHFASGFRSTREFLLGLDRVHDIVTRSIEGARPPRFTHEWRDEHTLRMTYRSERGLIELFASLTRALGRHFGEDIDVRRIGRDVLDVRFPRVAERVSA